MMGTTYRGQTVPHIDKKGNDVAEPHIADPHCHCHPIAWCDAHNKRIPCSCTIEGEVGDRIALVYVHRAFQAPTVRKEGRDGAAA